MAGSNCGAKKPDQFSLFSRLLCFYLFIFVFSNYASAAQPAAGTLQIFGGRVNLTIPSGFSLIDSTSEKLHFEGRDNAILIISLEPDSVSDNDIPLYTDIRLKHLKQNKGFLLIDDGISLNDGKNIGYLWYVADDAAVQYFFTDFYGSLEGRIVLLSFRRKDKKSPEASAISECIRTLQISD